MNRLTRFLIWLGVLATPEQDAYFAAADARLDQLELIRRIGATTPPGETPRARKVRMAILAIEARGQQPSPRLVQLELGEPVRNGGDLNGRDSRVYAETMMALGYVRQPRGRVVRWVRYS